MPRHFAPKRSKQPLEDGLALSQVCVNSPVVHQREPLCSSLSLRRQGQDLITEARQLLAGTPANHSQWGLSYCQRATRPKPVMTALSTACRLLIGSRHPFKESSSSASFVVAPVVGFVLKPAGQASTFSESALDLGFEKPHSPPGQTPRSPGRLR